MSVVRLAESRFFKMGRCFTQFPSFPHLFKMWGTRQAFDYASLAQDDVGVECGVLVERGVRVEVDSNADSSLRSE